MRLAVVVWIGTVACWRGSQPPRDTPLENRGPIAQDDRDGTAYLCSIRDGEFEYPQMPCAIRTVDGAQVLAKLAGSQRFRGVVKPHAGGFTFDGQMFCPWGDCAKALVGVFVPLGDGSLQGRFENESMIVTLVPAPAGSAWGGVSYGGDGYGGVGYGGAGYGGGRRR